MHLSFKETHCCCCWRFLFGRGIWNCTSECVIVYFKLMYAFFCVLLFCSALSFLQKQQNWLATGVSLDSDFRLLILLNLACDWLGDLFIRNNVDKILIEINNFWGVMSSLNCTNYDWIWPNVLMHLLGLSCSHINIYLKIRSSRTSVWDSSWVWR